MSLRKHQMLCEDVKEEVDDEEDKMDKCSEIGILPELRMIS